MILHRSTIQYKAPRPAAVYSRGRHRLAERSFHAVKGMSSRARYWRGVGAPGNQGFKRKS
jgi:hypothetical protein